MTFTEYLFWGLLSLAGYVYVVYPTVLFLLARCCSTSGGPVEQTDPPMVSLILYAHRCEATILKRLQNLVLSDYPADRFEVIVGCDGDEDLTGDLVRSFEDPRVRLVELSKQRGKAAMFNECVSKADGEILVFADAESIPVGDTLQRLVRHFRDSNVGGVYGGRIPIDSLTRQDIISFSRMHHNFLKRYETRAGMFPGEDSPLFAIRKTSYEPLPVEAVHHGFLIGMRLHRKGLQLVFDETAKVYLEVPHIPVSILHGSLELTLERFRDFLRLLRPKLFPRGRTAVAFWSRKVLRRFGPVSLILALILNAALSADPFYLRVFLMHVLAYILGGLVLWIQCEEQPPLLSRIAKVPTAAKSKLPRSTKCREKCFESGDSRPTKDRQESEEQFLAAD